MPDAETAALKSSERREQFRAYMRAFNPTAPARDIIEAGFVFEDLHAGLFQHLAARADLEPGSQQLLIGGIGSGKTTELLLADNWLRVHGDVLTLYIDITAETDLSVLNSGALIAGFGIHLARLLPAKMEGLPKAQAEQLRQARQKIVDYSFGRTERVWVSFEDDETWEQDDEPEPPEGYYTTVKRPGKLQPPLPALRRDLHEIRNPLEVLLSVPPLNNKPVVVLFDGLDRLIDPDKFWAVAHQDLRLLRALHVSVISTGPISLLYGTGRSVTDQFDRVHHLSPVFASEPPQLDFLKAVLTKRGGQLLLSENDAASICLFSGGVLRDLISLARDAGEEAYLSGSSRIEANHVNRSIEQLGISYLRGLGREQIKTLHSFAAGESFDLKSPSNMELLVSRRVLEQSSTSFVVHPALYRVLPPLEMDSPKNA
jgi:hypothetical protein